MLTKSKQYIYRELSLADFSKLFQHGLPQARLYELTLPWLAATANHMVNTEQVIVHCLYKRVSQGEAQILIAWPLVHNDLTKQISSLTSFYSAIAEPIFFEKPNKINLHQLLSYVEQSSPWRSLLLGPFDSGLMQNSVRDYFPFQRVFSQSDNIYQEGIVDYQQYYQQRPSQLRNTIKRRQQKLTQVHQYRIEIITSLSAFSRAFDAYKTIYKQSWKGNEFSYDFIEEVCLAALAENKLRLGLLWVDDEPAAAQLWFLQSTSTDDNTTMKTASIFKLAYNPKYQKFSVGSLLSLALSEQVITKDKVTSIEFGMGGERYKQDWLTSKRTRQVLQVFNQQTIYGKLAIVRQLLIARLVNLFKRK
ncbi:GNAT family N-acetyltransferase [Colwelliaceae bacterium MEBiC 14330]